MDLFCVQEPTQSACLGKFVCWFVSFVFCVEFVLPLTRFVGCFRGQLMSNISLLQEPTQSAWLGKCLFLFVSLLFTHLVGRHFFNLSPSLFFNSSSLSGNSLQKPSTSYSAFTLSTSRLQAPFVIFPALLPGASWATGLQQRTHPGNRSLMQH